jgi:hypothetical protein
MPMDLDVDCDCEVGQASSFRDVVVDEPVDDPPVAPTWPAVP